MPLRLSSALPPLLATFASFATLASCAPRAMPLAADHPAHPDAEPGRLAGPPPALRPGIVTLDAPAAPAPAHGPADAHGGDHDTDHGADHGTDHGTDHGADHGTDHTGHP